ncbi:DUF4180 domain-containing protein [Mucilaginibacter aquatilis]|uniref:DUF4180 domain-containing protein n=1 Tax=Mucilaginibacter aquatilis TaxID=1517760 RepID=A0A6I4IA58_9SPHI|nr:DUF4180 domain-containing protein [Mucilaginibacter aquatilis]MVN90376.1 DUF4180 domain-containing protein [Mucilaginibacter aquatilis]
MNIEIIEHKGVPIALVSSQHIIISNEQNALDLLANCGYQGADAIIINEENVSSDFFELSTKLAGNVLQKFSNYRMQLAIVGSFDKYDSKSLRDFIYESNKGKRINFVSSIDEAKAALTNS